MENKNKVTFVVIEENALCYVLPEQPSWAHILSASIVRGSVHRDGDFIHLSSTPNKRPATRQDFDTYRVSSAGYDTDARYDFPKE